MKKIFLAFALTACASSAWAQECVDIVDDLERLECYDAAAGVMEREVQSPVSDWVVEIETSAFEDTTDVFVSVDSREPVACQPFGPPQPASLVIRCLENTTSVFIVTGNCHLASGFEGYGSVDVRVDSKPSRTVSMNASTSNRALGFWRGNQAIAFIQGNLLGGERLLTRFTPYGRNPTTAEFNISGIDEALEPLRAECGW